MDKRIIVEMLNKCVEASAKEMAKKELSIFNFSSVGQCGGKCKGYDEENPLDMCPECIEALKIETKDFTSLNPDVKKFCDMVESMNEEEYKELLETTKIISLNNQKRLRYMMN